MKTLLTYPTYWLFKPWIQWFVPLPILVWILKRNFSTVVVFYDAGHRLEFHKY